MPDQVYDWKRFWCPRSSRFELGDRGYLTDPDSEWGKYCNSGLISFQSIAAAQCLVLLGEPGIGKSQELQKLRNYTQITLDGSDRLLPLDLQAYSSESALLRNLFESKTFSDWVNGTHRLHLFLDSLDEGLLKIDTLSMFLTEELSKEEYREHLSRLYFRITCRTAVFPKSFEEGLNQLWNNDVQIYELVPLRRIDVKMAANNCGLDADSFLEAVEDKGVVPFAIKPITLQFLISILQRNDKRFPQHLTNLYLEGCKILCEERKDQNYHPSRKASRIDIEQRLIIAARIAAVTVFARKYAIWTGSLGGVPDEDIFLEKLCLGSESANQRSVEITPAVIREVLDTGLFSSRGANRMGWAHQSYPEFLAAWYLKQHDLSLDQTLSLIIHPDQRVIPQLHETVAWLTSLEPQIFQSVMATDPDVLLQSEILTDSDEEKAAVLDSLLALHDQSKLVYQTHLPELSPYKRWNHAKLSDQLRPYICGSTKSEMSRYVAIDIAEACNVQAVQDYLADVALDSTQSYWVRVKSAKAVKRLGDDKTKLRLRPLAVSKCDDDLEDELKGHALRTLYPKHLIAIEVLNSITQPRSKVIGGTYQDFLAKEFAQHLQTSDLPTALTWLEMQPVLHDSHYPFNALSDRILLKAWQHLDIQAVLELFARIVLLKIRAYQQVIDSTTGSEFIDLLAENDTKRRLLLETIIENISETEEKAVYCLAGVGSSVTPLDRDFSWLIEKFCSSASEQVQKTYAQLIFLKFRQDNADQISEIITTSEISPSLAAKFAPLLETIELDSAQAEAARAEYLRQQNQVRKHVGRKVSILEPSLRERVLTCLEQFESGAVEAWWYLCKEMTLMPTSQRYGDSWKSDLTSLPGWEEVDDVTRKRIINAAKRYINIGDPETDAWFGTNRCRYSALAGYKALRLVFTQESQFIPNISGESWRKWTAVILDYPNSNDSSNKEHREPLLRLAYENAPDEFITRLVILLDQDNAQCGNIYISSQIECCWNEKLEIALCDKLYDEKLTANSIESLLKLLLERQVESAKIFAQAQVSTPPPSTGKAREIAIAAAQMLMLYTDNESWALVWNASQHDLEYRKKVLEALSFANEFQGSIEYRLREDYIADLYLFLVEHYPDSPKPQENLQSKEFNVDEYRIDAEDSIRRWRDQIPQRLQERGTREACEALRKIIHELPEQKDKLQWRLPEAEASARRKEWRPPQPEEILQLLANQEPSNLELHTQLVTINRRTQKMADEPKIDQSIHVTNSQVSGVVGSGKIEHKTDPLPKKGVDWKFWIPASLGVAALAISGLFNNEIRRFLKLDSPPSVEHKLEKK